MPGAIATGNPHTTEAARLVLEAGGNAVDAAIAACAASFIAEPLLASAGGAGMLCASIPGHKPVVVDFFSAMPGLGAKSVERDFRAVEIDFGSATQIFHVGRGSAAAPMALAGLALTSKELGSMPLREVVAPAVALAKRGASVTKESADVFSLLWPINLLDDATAAVYSDSLDSPAAGFCKAMPGHAELLTAFGEEERTPAYFREKILASFGPDQGGSLTPADLDAKPRLVQPHQAGLSAHTLFLSPRLGGHLLALIVQTLASADQDQGAAELRRVAAACRAGSRAKGDERALGSTTHISVVDAAGGAASVTLTNGEGSGYLVPGTDVQLNNFCGEEDLHPGGFFAHTPGTPLPSMIAPTIAHGPSGEVLALGSGGANRIRSVVAQALYRVVTLGESLESAILAPRVHAEEDAVWFEALGEEMASKKALSKDFERVFDFPTRAFFFGGVHAAHKSSKGFDAFADPRRGGKAVLL